MWPVIIGAALGAVKGQADRKRVAEDQKLQSLKTRYSGFTGRAGKDPKQVDELGAIMQGAAAGLMMGQKMDALPGGAAQAPNMYGGPTQQQAASTMQAMPGQHNLYADPAMDLEDVDTDFLQDYNQRTVGNALGMRNFYG